MSDRGWIVLFLHSSPMSAGDGEKRQELGKGREKEWGLRGSSCSRRLIYNKVCLSFSSLQSPLHIHPAGGRNRSKNPRAEQRRRGCGLGHPRPRRKTTQEEEEGPTTHRAQSPCPNPDMGPQRCWPCPLVHSWRKTVKPSVTDKSNSESPLFALRASD